MNKYVKIILFISLLLAFISTISYCSAPYDTETANMISIRKTVNGEGYILRRETVIETSSKGVFEPSAEDGVRVGGGSVVGVSISGNYNETLVKELEDVTARIDEVKKSDSFADIYASDDARIFTALRDISKEIRKSAQDGDFALASQNAHQLEMLLEKKYSSENRGAAQELLAELEEKKASLEQSLGSIRENVVAPASGYFYPASALDGLEQKSSDAQLSKITTADIGKIPETLDNYKKTQNQVGKIVDTYSWYLAAVLPDEDAQHLSSGASVTVSIDEGTPLKATVLAVNPDEAGYSAVVIKCTRDMNGIFEKRFASFEICYEEHSGLYVPAAAMRIKNDVTGVYVLNKNESVSFRAIDILSQEEDFLIVRSAYKPPADSEYSALKIYDDVLVNPEVLRKSELTE